MLVNRHIRVWSPLVFAGGRPRRQPASVYEYCTLYCTYLLVQTPLLELQIPQLRPQRRILVADLPHLPLDPAAGFIFPSQLLNLLVSFRQLRIQVRYRR